MIPSDQYGGPPPASDPRAVPGEGPEGNPSPVNDPGENRPTTPPGQPSPARHPQPEAVPGEEFEPAEDPEAEG